MNAAITPTSVSLTDNVALIDDTLVLVLSNSSPATPYNLTASCQDVDKTLATPWSAYNCMVYAQVAHRMADGDLTSTGISNARAMGIEETSYDTHADAIYETYHTCLQDYVNYLSPKVDASTYCFLDASSRTRCFPNPCLHLDVSINQDLGGIGVFLSFLIQVGLAVCLFLALRVATSWVYYPGRIIALFQGSLKKSRACAMQWQNNTRRYLFDPVVSAIIDFHKVQCFFMIALQIAALVSVGSQGIASLGSKSMSQLMVW